MQLKLHHVVATVSQAKPTKAQNQPRQEENFEKHFELLKYSCTFPVENQNLIEPQFRPKKKFYSAVIAFSDQR
jgi:hypothetical protein